MKLEIGMYVRTECGIAKINGFEANNIQINLDKDIMICNMDIYRNCCSHNQISKASYNIIDLIEENDFVKLEYYVAKYRQRITRIFEVKIFNNHVIFENLYCSFHYDKKINKFVDGKGFNPKIKSIVTKEQFESMEYKVGD